MGTPPMTTAPSPVPKPVPSIVIGVPRAAEGVETAVMLNFGDGDGDGDGNGAGTGVNPVWELNSTIRGWSVRPKVTLLTLTNVSIALVPIRGSNTSTA